MKIVIAGAGAVGTHLARLLSKDNMNVVLMDSDVEKLSKVNSDLDIMTLPKSPSSIKGLKDADVDGADLFIAVTPHESENISCCMLAKQLGAQRTVARVDNYEYMKPENLAIFRNMGVESLVYPELLASYDIAASARYSWVRQLWEFNNGDMLLLSVMMHDTNIINGKGICNENNQLVGHTLKQIGVNYGHDFHVVAIKRGGETVVPYGDEKILPRDLVFFMTTREGINTIRHLSGKDDYPNVNHTVIIGGSKLAVRADWALPDSYTVKIIEPNQERCLQLGSLTKQRTLIINGEGYDMELLNDEGFSNQEAFFALTDNDEQNILACVAARRRGVRKTIAQVENIGYFDMAEDLDVGTIINKKVIAASHIYRMLLQGDVDNVKMLTVADADVAEFVVKEGSRVTKKTIMDLGMPHGVNIGGMIRDGKSMLVQGLTQLQAGDKVVVFCIGNTLKKLDKWFN
ncbi:MAG: Trk system potassium transporter TrkA [Bacteroidaceae bacterium]|jgi:trk system potassium uptake protein TrkA|nr:Trk system potassium transporter TrkA [Bacteroidaceae bacterium]MBR6197425.1 Trk system potassium transporter TrkA [Bacteroidaceae bacterium]